MFKNKNITRYYRDESERRLLDRSYTALISDDFSVERKLTAVEYLYRFIDLKEHRERLEILLSRELNPRIRKHLQSALDGTLFDFINKRFDAIDSFDEEIDAEFEKNKQEAKTELSQEIQSSLAYIRYSSQ